MRRIDRNLCYSSKTIEGKFLILPSAFCVSFVSPTFALATLASLTVYSTASLHAELTRWLPPTRSLPVASLTVYPPAARHGVFPALFTFRLGRKVPSGSRPGRETRAPCEANRALPDQF